MRFGWISWPVLLLVVFPIKAEDKIKIVKGNGVETIYNLRLNKANFEATPTGSSYPLIPTSVSGKSRQWKERISNKPGMTCKPLSRTSSPNFDQVVAETKNSLVTEIQLFS